jgi:hypothetical protein
MSAVRERACAWTSAHGSARRKKDAGCHNFAQAVAFDRRKRTHFTRTEVSRLFNHLVGAGD